MLLEIFQSSFSNLFSILQSLANFKRVALYSSQCTFGTVGSRSVPKHENRRFRQPNVKCTTNCRCNKYIN